MLPEKKSHDLEILPVNFPLRKSEWRFSPNMHRAGHLSLSPGCTSELTTAAGEAQDHGTPCTALGGRHSAPFQQGLLRSPSLPIAPPPTPPLAPAHAHPATPALHVCLLQTVPHPWAAGLPPNLQPSLMAARPPRNLQTKTAVTPSSVGRFRRSRYVHLATKVRWIDLDRFQRY